MQPTTRAKGDGESVSDLLRCIAANAPPHVREVDASLPEELDAICAKAMAKSRDERYASAKELKAALLEFQVHKESIDLTATAATDLELARRSGQYDDFSRARFGFEEASRQWPANIRASAGITETRSAFAQCAFDRGDYDLALSLLDESKLNALAGADHWRAEEHQPLDELRDSQEARELMPAMTHGAFPGHAALRAKIQLAIAERASRQHRLRRLRRISIAASLAAAMIASIAALWINALRRTATIEKQNAINAQIAAETAQKEESRQRGLAVTAQKEAEAAKQRIEESQGEVVRQIELLGLEEGLRRLVQDKQKLWLFANKKIEPLHKRRSDLDADASMQTFASFLQTQRSQFTPESRIELQSAGPIGHAEFIDTIAEFLRLFYGISVRILPANDQMTLPQREHSGRKQWRAADVIRSFRTEDLGRAPDEAFLSQNASNNATQAALSEDQRPNAFLLIITDQDLWSGDLKNNFVFGVNNIKLHTAVMSLNRFQSSSPPSNGDVILLRRALKVAVFLAGQNAGIRDFAGYSCCMNRTNNVPDLDQSPLAFCPECERKVWWLADSDPTERYTKLKEFAAKHGLREEQIHWENALRAIRSGTERP